MTNFVAKTLLLAQNRLARLRAQQHPIFILQMGRVGSASVLAAVKQAYKDLALETPVYHSHYIANYDRIAERASRDLQDPSGVARDIERVDKKNRDVLFSHLNRNETIKIISLVRDPVARNVSTFFYALPEFLPNWKEMEVCGALPSEELHVIFETKQSYIQTALNWFDEQLRDGLNIDIYTLPFRKERGYQIYHYDKIQLLILRMEDLFRTGEHALRSFLGLRHLQIGKINTGAEREAYELYRRFLTRSLSRRYLEPTYSSQLARHFYTENEIEQFMFQWSNPGAV